MAKKEKTKNPEVKEKKKRNLKRNKARGNDFERKIVRELKDLGFPNVRTSRSESKHMDDCKVDIIDKDNLLPCWIQTKATIKTPNFLEIEKACPFKDKPFCVIWSAIKPTESTFRSLGEVVIIRKEFFYDLIKHYGKSNSNI